MRKRTMPDTTPVTDRDVYITRAFDAPVERVWRFFTQPELISQWFGPDGFDVPLDTVVIELQIGGRWELTMRDMTSGSLYPIKGTITQLEPNEYIEVAAASAMTDSGELEDLGLRITFHDHGERTRVTLHQGEFSDEQKKETAVGWEMSFVKMDRLFESADA
jgi:uncharacterized protein YndB with AHSA1/START domain